MQKELLLIRRATTDDEDLMFNAYAASRAPEFEGLNWPQPQLDGFLRMQFDARSRVYQGKFPDSGTYVLEYGKVAAGVYIIQRSESVTRLIDIVVLPQFQGKNIGTQTIRRLLDEGRAVELSVEFSNIAARRLYERLGFKTLEHDDVYHRMRWEPR